MKGKILLGVTVLIVIGLFVSGYFSPSTINSAIETTVGVKTVSLDELKQMAEEGKISYEVYRLALYVKLKDPDIAFRIHDSKVEIGRIREDLLKLKPKIYARDWSVLEGRYVEKINDTWLRVVIVDYDDLFANRYYSVKVDVATEMRSGYVVDGGFPSYLKLINETDGKWESQESGHYIGKLKVKNYYNPNPEDARISKIIAEQVARYASENGMTSTQTVELVYAGLVYDVIDYVPDNSWIGKPFTTDVLDENRLLSVNITKSDSLMESFLLYGRGSCYAQTTFVVYVLNWMGVRTGGFVSKNFASDEWHEDLVISKNFVSINELILPKLDVEIKYSIKPLVTKTNGKEEQWVVYSIMNYGYNAGASLIDRNVTAELLLYEFNKN